jgi:hypothetical protein
MVAEGHKIENAANNRLAIESYYGPSVFIKHSHSIIHIALQLLILAVLILASIPAVHFCNLKMRPLTILETNMSRV